METRKFVLLQSLRMLAGTFLLSALMVILFSALGYYDRSVLLGAAAGALIATANHGFLVLGVVAASEKAKKQDVRAGQAVIGLSRLGRMAGLFLALMLFASSGQFNPLALVLPLLFSRPILSLTELINTKKGGKRQ